jgi:hypothetical protein
MSEPKMRRVPVNPKSGSQNAIPDFGGRSNIIPTQVVACSCPHLDHDEWDVAENDWSDITFLKGTTTAVMGVPVSYSSLTTELREKAAQRGLVIPDDPMVLLGEGKFRRPLLLEVEAPDSETKDIYRPGGFAFTHVAPGPPGKVRDLLSESRKMAKEKYGRDPDAHWIWYLTCRECSGPRDYETLIALHYRQRK